MKFVLNKCYGGFSISDFAQKKLGIDTPYPELDELTTDALAALIVEFGSERVSGRNAKLRVVEIPNDVTDYEINEYDGIESITYVLDGKLYHA